MEGRKAFEVAHLIAVGMGGNRKKGTGNGCGCDKNLLKVTAYEHDLLDARLRDIRVERKKEDIKEALLEKGYKLSQIHKIAWGEIFGYRKEILKAIDHNRLRKQGKVECCK